jgi:hypothetical protein
LTSGTVIVQVEAGKPTRGWSGSDEYRKLREKLRSDPAVNMRSVICAGKYIDSYVTGKH